ncbi:hypothetical protein M9H77_04062 [Catharanthus roseus]|uniref:Uncharacterized protein n=1 Tax=Catharanthus roseus TaxID=4058 RepID=A0ACC0CD06_CATRO|nr:hypothetical protein M9H77_04062 [Catharanthus roseus]
MRVSSAAGKSEQIKTHQRSFYAPNLKEHSGSPKRGHRNQVPTSRSQEQPNTIRALDYKTTALPYHWSKQATDSWGTYQATIPPQSMMRCPRKYGWAKPSRYYAPLQVDPPSESKTRPRHQKRL